MIDRSARKLSVIIPVRNGAATLPPLLDAFERQRAVPGWSVEVIAGVSPSSDDTERILRERGVAIASSETLGPSAGRNAAVRAATGSLLCFIDADAAPVGDEFFRRVVALGIHLAQDGKLGAYGGPILLDPAQRTNPIAAADHFACWFNWSDARPTQPSRLFQPSVCLAMPRDVFEKLGGFDEGILVLEDFELEARIFAQKLRVYFANELRVTHRARGTLLSSWRHSWSWGVPYRRNYLAQTITNGLRVPVGSRAFALNLPFIFARRLRLVMRSAWRVSPRRALAAAPFIAATVFAWALGVALGSLEAPRART